MTPTATHTHICRDMTDFEDFTVKSKIPAPSKHNHNFMTGILKVHWNFYFWELFSNVFPLPWRTQQQLEVCPKSKFAPSRVRDIPLNITTRDGTLCSPLRSRFSLQGGALPKERGVRAGASLEERRSVWERGAENGEKLSPPSCINDWSHPYWQLR